MILLLFYAIISIFFSFLCSILEAVLLSVTPTFVNVKITEGKTYAKTLEKIKEDVDKPLIAILTLNTIAHTVGAILVGVQAKKYYAEAYSTDVTSILGFELTEDLLVGIISTIMTILILVVSEIIPKTIGVTYWKKLAQLTTNILSALIFLSNGPVFYGFFNSLPNFLEKVTMALFLAEKISVQWLILLKKKEFFKNLKVRLFAIY